MSEPEFDEDDQQPEDDFAVDMAKDMSLINKRLFLAELVHQYDGLKGVCQLSRQEFDQTAIGSPPRREMLKQITTAILSHGVDDEEPPDDPEQLRLELRSALRDELRSPDGVSMIADALRHFGVPEHLMDELSKYGISQANTEG